MTAQTRKVELVTLAIDAMEDGRDPFDGHFLREHVVTSDELFDMSDVFCTALRAWIQGPSEVAALAIERVLIETVGPDATRFAMATHRLGKATRKAERSNG